MNAPSAIVIGSGIAGLAAAIRLSVQGYQVVVYEKNSSPGGKLGILEKEGYRFDTGPSLFTEPENIEALFRLAGEPIDEYLQYEPVPCTCKYFFANGKVVNAWADREQFLEEMETNTGEPRTTMQAYLQQSKELYDDVADIFLNNSLNKIKTWGRLRVLKALSSIKPSFLFKTLNEYHQAAFTTGEAIQMFNRFATYNGSNPYKAPAMLTVIPNIELNHGVYYPKGGMISIVNALYKLAIKKGVLFEFNSPVQRIIQTGDHVSGVVVGNKNFFSDIVVSNADVIFTYRHLLQRSKEASVIQKREFSSSAIVFYWGIKKQFTQMQLHNIFFSGDYIHEFRELFERKKAYKDPTVYINITSKMEAGHAPEGRENWFVMINAPSVTKANWQEQIPYIRQQVLKKLRGMLKEDIEPLIETEQILDPTSIEAQTNTWGGAIYGSASNNRMSAFRRPANFDSNIPGVYFCGGTVHPGGGIPLCLKSAQIVAELVGEKSLHQH